MGQSSVDSRLAILRCLDEETREDLEDGAFLLLVELFPQVRLGNRDFVEVQIQLRHGPPGWPPIFRASRGSGAGEHRRGGGVAGGPRTSRSVEEVQLCGRVSENPSSQRGSATCCRRARKARTASRRACAPVGGPPKTGLRRDDADA